MMIKIGDPIRLEPLDGSARQYRSKVLAVDGGAIHIGYPVDEQTGKTVYLLNGMQFKASFVSQEGTLYMFDTEVKGMIRCQWWSWITEATNMSSAFSAAAMCG